MSKPEMLLVTGASGQLGRLVLDALVRSGEQRVIATTRKPETLADYAQKGVQVRAADFNEPESLVEAFSGATVMLLISTHEVGARVKPHLAAIEAAKKAGVRHIVYTSHSECETSVSAVAPEHAVTEKAIRESGLKYTLLRHFLYAEMLLEILAGSLQSGTIYGASGDGKIAFVTRRDLADADAGTLIHAKAHENATYDLTGPRSYSYTELARILSDILGRQMTYVNLAPEDYKAALLRQGMPEKTADAFLTFERSTLLGELDRVTDMVQKLAGHAPETLENFLRHNLFSGDKTATMDFLMKGFKA